MRISTAIPVMILGDGMIGQMMEPVEFHSPTQAPQICRKRPGPPPAGMERRQRAIINSLYIEPEVMRGGVNDRLQKRYDAIKQNETRVEELQMEDAEYCIAAYGTTARIAKSAVAQGPGKGHQGRA